MIVNNRSSLAVLFMAAAALMAIAACGTSSSHDSTVTTTPPDPSQNSWTAISMTPEPSTTAADPQNADYLIAVRAAGAQGSDEQLSTDGLASCADLRGDVNNAPDTVIGASMQLTRPPFNFSPHAADEIVINAVKYICPEMQGKVDDPTGGN